MPFDDLDLEFEDEAEAKKKKSEAVDVEVDLEFTSPAISVPKALKAATGTASRPINSNRPAEIKKLDEARANASKIKPSTVIATSAEHSTPKIQGTSALKMEPHSDLAAQEVVALREQVKQLELEGQVKVAIAEHKIELLSELLSDIKLMDHQIGQLLIRINAKHPDLKQEVLTIKKILADFTAKKRK